MFFSKYVSIKKSDSIFKVFFVGTKLQILFFEELKKSNVLIFSFDYNLVFFHQILGICFAQNLRADIFAQKAKWH